MTNFIQLYEPGGRGILIQASAPPPPVSLFLPDNPSGFLTHVLHGSLLCFLRHLHGSWWIPFPVSWCTRMHSTRSQCFTCYSFYRYFVSFPQVPPCCVDIMTDWRRYVYPCVISVGRMCPVLLCICLSGARSHDHLILGDATLFLDIDRIGTRVPISPPSSQHLPVFLATTILLDAKHHSSWLWFLLSWWLVRVGTSVLITHLCIIFGEWSL